jgi:hypothetical protein
MSEKLLNAKGYHRLDQWHAQAGLQGQRLPERG